MLISFPFALLLFEGKRIQIYISYEYRNAYTSNPSEFSKIEFASEVWHILRKAGVADPE